MTSNEQISTSLLTVAEHLKDLVKTQQRIAMLLDKNDLQRRLSEIEKILSSDCSLMTKQEKGEIIRRAKSTLKDVLFSLEE